MAKGRKTGGRVAGTPNKATAEVSALIDALAGPGAERCWTKLAEIALTPHDNVPARLTAIRTLLEYRHGRPTERHEHTGTNGAPIVFTWQSTPS